MEKIRPIGLKLTVLFVLGIIVSYGLLTYLIVKRETSIAIENYTRYAELTATTVKAVLSESMLAGNPAETSKYLKKLAREGLLSVNVFDPDGNGVFNGKRHLEIPNEVLMRFTPISRMMENNIRFFMSLRNEKQCMKCHKSGPVRGVVVVDIPLEQVKSDVAETEKRLILYGLLVIGLGIAGSVIIINRMVTRPIKAIGGAIKSYMGDGGLREINLKGNDELTEVAEAFDKLTRRLSDFHAEMERMVQERTEALQKTNKELKAREAALRRYSGDLKKVSTFSNRFVSRDRTLKEVLQCFVMAIKEELGFGYAGLYLLDNTHDSLNLFVATEEQPVIKEDDELLEIFYMGEIVIREVEGPTGVNIFIPLYMLKRGRCYELNRCELTHCPCYGKDTRCWQVPHTKCERFHGVGLMSCRQCPAFPLRGVLVLGGQSHPTEHDIGILEVISSEISLVCEAYDFIRYEKNMVSYLLEIHKVFVKSQAAKNLKDLFQWVANSPKMREIIPGMALYLKDEQGRMVLEDTNLDEEFPIHDLMDIFKNGSITKPIELYDIKIKNYYSVVLCPLIKNNNLFGTVGFFFKHKGILLPEERAVTLVLSQNLSGNIENIELRKDLERSNMELREQKDFIEDIFRSINSGIIVVDGNDRLLNANPYALKTLDLSEDEFKGMPLDEAMPGVRKLFSEGKNEGSIMLSSGREIYLGFSFSPFRGTEGEKGSVILFRDLTEIIDLRNELQRKKYFSTIGEMASLIAHEVRNPVFAISSIARILIQKYDNEEERMFARSILKESERLNALIEDLLNYGKPLSLEKQDISVRHLLNGALSGIRSFIEESGCRLNVQEVDEVLTVSADPERIKQVFYNAVKNAIDAGASNISISVTSRGRYREITIKDDGKGIKQDDLEKVMKPFFTTKKEGTGLGLPICKKIVEAHGGRLDIVSEQGKGTSLTIALRGAK